MSNVRGYVNIKLSHATAAQLAHRPVECDAGFTWIPEKYTIKFLARDDDKYFPDPVHNSGFRT